MPLWWWVLWFVTAVALSLALGWWFLRHALREDREMELDRETGAAHARVNAER
jgi:hypothetical protein